MAVYKIEKDGQIYTIEAPDGYTADALDKDLMAATGQGKGLIQQGFEGLGRFAGSAAKGARGMGYGAVAGVGDALISGGERAADALGVEGAYETGEKVRRGLRGLQERAENMPSSPGELIVNSLFPGTKPREEGGIPETAGQAVGSMGAFLAGGAATKAAPYVLGAAAGLNQETRDYEDFIAKHGQALDPDRRDVMQLLGAGIGATEGLNVEKILRLPDVAVKTLKDRLKNMAIQGTIEAAQEGGSNVASNAAKQAVYNPDQELVDSTTGEQAGIGGVLGGTLGLLLPGSRHAHVRTPEKAPAEDEQRKASADALFGKEEEKKQEAEPDYVRDRVYADELDNQFGPSDYTKKLRKNADHAELVNTGEKQISDLRDIATHGPTESARQVATSQISELEARIEKARQALDKSQEKPYDSGKAPKAKQPLVASLNLPSREGNVPGQTTSSPVDDAVRERKLKDEAQQLLDAGDYTGASRVLEKLQEPIKPAPDLGGTEEVSRNKQQGIPADETISTEEPSGIEVGEQGLPEFARDNQDVPAYLRSNDGGTNHTFTPESQAEKLARTVSQGSPSTAGIETDETTLSDAVPDSESQAVPTKGITVKEGGQKEQSAFDRLFMDQQTEGTEVSEAVPEEVSMPEVPRTEPQLAGGTVSTEQKPPLKLPTKDEVAVAAPSEVYPKNFQPETPNPTTESIDQSEREQAGQAFPLVQKEMKAASEGAAMARPMPESALDKGVRQEEIVADEKDIQKQMKQTEKEMTRLDKEIANTRSSKKKDAMVSERAEHAANYKKLKQQLSDAQARKIGNERSTPQSKVADVNKPNEGPKAPKGKDIPTGKAKLPEQQPVTNKVTAVEIPSKEGKKGPKGSPERVNKNGVSFSVDEDNADLPPSKNTAKSVERQIRTQMRVDSTENALTVVDSAEHLSAQLQEELDDADPRWRKVQGFVHNGRVYLIASNLRGDPLSVFLHEAGGHLGLKKLLGPKFEVLSSLVEDWAREGTAKLRTRIAQAAMKRAQQDWEAYKKTAEYQRVAEADPMMDVLQHDPEEALAYFIEEAVKRGIDPTAVNTRDSKLNTWFRNMWAQMKKALRQFQSGDWDRLDPQHVVDLAYGAARMELTRPKYHGTNARFRQLRTKYMGTGEGAQAFGWGHYLTEDEYIAEDYRKHDVARKKMPRYETSNLPEFPEVGLYGKDGELLSAAQVMNAMGDMADRGDTPRSYVETAIGKVASSVENSMSSGAAINRTIDMYSERAKDARGRIAHYQNQVESSKKRHAKLQKEHTDNLGMPGHDSEKVLKEMSDTYFQMTMAEDSVSASRKYAANAQHVVALLENMKTQGYEFRPMKEIPQETSPGYTYVNDVALTNENTLDQNSPIDGQSPQVTENLLNMGDELFNEYEKHVAGLTPKQYENLAQFDGFKKAMDHLDKVTHLATSGNGKEWYMELVGNLETLNNYLADAGVDLPLDIDEIKKEVSLRMDKHGVNGMRFLAAGNRAGDKPNHKLLRNYVVFNDRTLHSMARYEAGTVHRDTLPMSQSRVKFSQAEEETKRESGENVKSRGPLGETSRSIVDMANGIYDGAADWMERSAYPKVKELGSKLRNYIQEKQGNIGALNHEIEKGYKAYQDNKNIQKDYQDFWQAMQAGDFTSARKIHDTASAPLLEAIDGTRAMFEKAAEIARKSGVKTKGADNKWRQFMPRKGFFPLMMKEEYMAAFRNPDGNKELINKVVKALMEDNKQMTREQAMAILERETSRFRTLDGFMGNIERARTDALPMFIYDFTMNSALKYKDLMAVRSAQIANFGQRADGAKNSFQTAHESLPTNEKNTRDYVASVAQMTYGLEDMDGNQIAPTWLSKMGAASSSFATANQLASPMGGAMTNIIGGQGLISGILSPKKLAQAWKSMFEERDAIIKEARQLGVVRDDLLNFDRDSEFAAGEKKGWWRTGNIARGASDLASKALELSQFNRSERFVRYLSYAALKHELREGIEASNANPKSVTAVKFKRMVEREGLSYDLLMTGNKEETDKFFRKFVNLIQGSYDLDQVSRYANTGVGRFILKYYKFVQQATRAYVRTKLEPLADMKLMRENPKVWGSYAIDALAYLLSALGAGLLTNELKKDLFGMINTSADPSRIWRAVATKDTKEAIDESTDVVMSNIFQSGLLGYIGKVGDFYQQNLARPLKGLEPERYVTSPLNIAGVGPVKDAVEYMGELYYLFRDHELGGENLKYITDKYLSSTNRFYRETERMGGKMAPDDTTIGKEAKAREDLRQTKKYVEQYLDSLKFKSEASKSRDVLDQVKNAFNPLADIKPIDGQRITNMKIVDALMVGDATTAQKLAIKWEEKAESLTKNTGRHNSIVEWVEKRHPLFVDAPNENKMAMQIGFIKWAKENLPKDEFETVVRISRTYHNAAVQAGLYKERKEGYKAKAYDPTTAKQKTMERYGRAN